MRQPSPGQVSVWYGVLTQCTDNLSAASTVTANGKLQVLEDLEALVRLLSTRASDAERNASSLQKQVTGLRAAAGQSSRDQAACNKQIDALKKEAAVAKRVFALVALLCLRVFICKHAGSQSRWSDSGGPNAFAKSKRFKCHVLG